MPADKKYIKPFLNSTLAKFAPGLAANRELNAARYEYLAARPSRSRSNNQRRAENPNAGRNENERRTLVDKCRDLYENNPVATGLIDRFSLLCFGRIEYAARTGDDARDELIEQYLEQECFPACDISGRFHLRDFVVSAHKARNNDGDILLAWRMCPDEDRPKLQAIESDRIGDKFTNLTTETYVAGIHIDPRTGKPFLYDVYRRQPNSDQLTFDWAVPAAYAIFLARHTRISRYRGIPVFAPVLESAQDLTEIIAATRDRVKFAASLSAISKRKGGGIDLDELINDGGSVNPVTREWEQATKFGQIYHLDEGEDITSFQGGYPDQSVQSFLDLLVQHFCLAMGLPKSIGYQLAGMSGPTVRMDAAITERVVQNEQQQIRRSLLDPAVRKWIRHGCLTGRLPYDANDPSIYQGAWAFPARLSIDARDERIDAEMVRSGLKSKLQFFEDRGRDYHDETRQIVSEQARERRLAQEAGVDYLDIRLVTQTGQQQATQGPLHEEQREDGEI